MPKTFPGEAPEPYSLNGQSGRSHTKTAPGCRVFRYWRDKTRTKDINRRADSGRPHCSPVRSGNCPERKQKHRIPMPKTFPGEAPELDSLTAQRGRSHTKTAPECRVSWLLDRQAKDKGHYPESRFRPAPVLTSERRKLSGKKTETPDTNT